MLSSSLSPRAKSFLLGPLSKVPFNSERCQHTFAQLCVLCAGPSSLNSTAHARSKQEGPSAEFRLPPFAPPGPLYPFQVELVEQLLGFSREGNRFVSLLALPTGAGKTRTALSFVLEWFSSSLKPRQVLWFAPTLELLEQASKTLETLWFDGIRRRGVSVFRRYIGSPKAKGSDHTVTFATVQSLLSALRRGLSMADIELAVYDEAHQAAAPATSELVSQLGEQSGTSVLGLSATPGRVAPAETQTLSALFGRSLVTPRSLRPNAIRALQQAGVLSHLSFRTLPVAVDLVGQKRVGSRAMGGRVMQSLELDTQRFATCVDAIKELCEAGHRTLVFTSTIAHSCAIAAACIGHGLPASAISGSMHATERVRTLELFSNGSLRILCSSRLLSQGYDLPALDAIVLTVPVASPILFEQMVGRVSRGPASGGTETGLVVDIDDHLALHGLPQSYHRFEDYEWG